MVTPRLQAIGHGRDLRYELPIITVTAEKAPEDKQKTPVSLTAPSVDALIGLTLKGAAG